MTRVVLWLCVACGALAIAACGSSGGTLNRSELVSKANSICSGAQKSASAVPSPTNLTDATVAAAYFDKIAPITDKETSDLAALHADGSASGDWGAFLSAQKTANGLLQTIRRKADAKDASGLQDLRQVPAAGDRVRTTALKLGAATCAQ